MIDEALVLESTLASLSKPSRRTLDAVRHEFFKSKSGQDEGYSVLGGASRHLFDDEHDLIAMRSVPHQDRMTKLVRDQLPLIFKVIGVLYSISPLPELIESSLVL
jgi:hypothetical protein